MIDKRFNVTKINKPENCKKESWSGNYINDQFTGGAIIQTDYVPMIRNSDIYFGQVKYSKRDGLGCVISNTSLEDERFVGAFKEDDKLHGFNISWLSDLTYETHFKNGDNYRLIYNDLEKRLSIYKLVGKHKYISRALVYDLKSEKMYAKSYDEKTENEISSVEVKKDNTYGFNLFFDCFQTVDLNVPYGYDDIGKKPNNCNKNFKVTKDGEYEGDFVLDKDADCSLAYHSFDDGSYNVGIKKKVRDETFHTVCKYKGEAPFFTDFRLNGKGVKISLRENTYDLIIDHPDNNHYVIFCLIPKFLINIVEKKTNTSLVIDDNLNIKIKRIEPVASRQLPLSRELFSYDFLLDIIKPQEVKKADFTSTKVYKKLEKLVGLNNVKDIIRELYDYSKKGRGVLNLSYILEGNPGVGKTTIVRILAEAFYEFGLLPTNKFKEVTRKDLVGIYVGETDRKMKEIIEDSIGGVLFIDDAYALSEDKNDKKDFGKEVINAINDEVEKLRGRISIILAGYRAEMADFLSVNPGLASRFGENIIVIEDYNDKELREIARMMIKSHPDIDSIDDDAFEEMMKYTNTFKLKEGFGNARSVREIVNQVAKKMIFRIEEDEERRIILKDVKKITQQISGPQISGEERLNQLIGLRNVKEKISRFNKSIIKNGAYDNTLNKNFIFYGNPGTGKTEVARILPDILYEINAFPTRNFVSVELGKCAGYDGVDIFKRSLDRAVGGVLFIDEAYYLGERGFENINRELLLALEKYQGSICFILAGYKEDLEQLINSNIGYRSRFPEMNRIDFKDYTIDELMEILNLYLNKDGYKVDEEAKSEIKKIILNAMDRFDYGNARFVRELVRGIYEFQNSRTYNNDDRNIIIDDVKNYELANDIVFKKRKDDIVINKEEISNLSNQISEFDVKELVSRSVGIKCGNSNGSGFIISPDGLVITNYHVVENARSVEIVYNVPSYNGDIVSIPQKAEILKFNKERDVCLLKMSGINNYPYYKLAKGIDDVNILDEVVMAGYPLGISRFENISVSSGKVLSKNLDNAVDDTKKVFVDIFGVPGNSGSAIINKKTLEVIGIFSGASLSRSGLHISEMNYAIAVDYIWDLFNQ